MARFSFAKSHIFLSSGPKIVAYDCKKGHKVEICECTLPAVDDIPSSKNIDKSTDKSVTRLEDTNRILCCAACACGNHLAASDDRKKLMVWQKIDSNFTLKAIREVPRKCVCVRFQPDVDDCGVILAADKTGDVLRLQWRDENEKFGKVLLGHLSIVLDLLYISEKKLLVTCDRDEKIRVSRFPNSYNIECYCLGHTEFVSCLATFGTSGKVLVSGSGDGSVRFWSLDDGGTEIAVLDCKSYFPDEMESSELEPRIERRLIVEKFALDARGTLAVQFYQRKLLALFKVTLGSKEVTESWRLLDTIHFTVPTWDIVFDDENRLWTVKPDKGHPVAVFAMDSNEKFVEITPEGQSEEPFNAVVESLNSDWTFFQSSLEVTSLIPILFKQHYDNVSKYMSQKEERITKKKKLKGSSG